MHVVNLEKVRTVAWDFHYPGWIFVILLRIPRFLPGYLTKLPVYSI
jgi:hypothetical protein